MNLVLVGLNHRTAPVALREQLALTDCALGMALEDIHTIHQAGTNGNGRQPGRSKLKEVIILSTCNRLEIYGQISAEPTYGWKAIEQFLCSLQGIPISELKPHLYYLENNEVVDHLMRVAAGLDSMILGEQQILGQVSAALVEAQRTGNSGPILTHLFELACHAGKRARTETEISRHTTSVSHAAAHLVADKLGELSEVNVLIIGAGEMAEVAAQAFVSGGAPQLSFINRTYSRAESLARQFTGRALNWYHLPAALALADVVVTATGAPHIVIHVDDVQPILAERRGRPLLFVDIAVPRDVEEKVGQLSGVQRYDIDHLQSTVDANMALRQAAIPDVEAIISQEAARFDEWLQGRQVLPVLVELRTKMRRIAEHEMARNLNQLDQLPPEHQQKVSQMVHRIVNKMLHEPTVRLKSAAAQGNGVEYASTIRELFDLNVFPPAAVTEINDTGSVEPVRSSDRMERFPSINQ